MPNEKKYVEANIVFDKLTEWAKNIRFELNWAELCKLNNCIIDAPVADVAEVRHGCWYNTENGYFCTLCNGDSYAEYDYCPRCGARMDGADSG